MGNCMSKSQQNNNQFHYDQYFNACLEKLNPSKIIPTRIFKKLLDQMKNLNMKNMFQFYSNNNQIDFLNKDSLLKIRWKIIIFCSGNDLYRENYFGHQQLILHQSFTCIQKDIERTFIDVEFFQNPLNINKLAKVLKNIALYFPKIGYTQGINFIVGFLLICGYTQQESFWLFVYLSTNENFMLMGLYEDKFPLAFIYSDLLYSLLKRYNPALLEKVNQLELPQETWIIHWFLTYFIIAFPLDVCKMFWDFIMITGGFGCVYLTYAILDQLTYDLLQIKEDFEFIEYFKNLKDRKFLKQRLDFTKLFILAKSIQLNEYQLSLQIKKIKQKNFYVNFYSNLTDPDFKNDQIKYYLNNIEKQRNIYFNPKFKMRILQKSLKTLKRTNPVYYYMLFRDNKNKNATVTQNGTQVVSTSKSTIIYSSATANLISSIKFSLLGSDSHNQIQSESDSQFNDQANQPIFDALISSTKST